MDGKLGRLALVFDFFNLEVGKRGACDVTPDSSPMRIVRFSRSDLTHEERGREETLTWLFRVLSQTLLEDPHQNILNKSG